METYGRVSAEATLLGYFRPKRPLPMDSRGYLLASNVCQNHKEPNRTGFVGESLRWIEKSGKEFTATSAGAPVNEAGALGLAARVLT